MDVYGRNAHDHELDLGDGGLGSLACGPELSVAAWVVQSDLQRCAAVSTSGCEMKIRQALEDAERVAVHGESCYCETCIEKRVACFVEAQLEREKDENRKLPVTWWRA